MKTTIISVIVVAVLIGGSIILTKNGSNNTLDVVANNVSIVDGKQIIEINAKGGYQPRKSIAKAGIPTIIRFNTKGTFDCSSAIRIPSLNIDQLLSPTASTDIDIGVFSVSTLLGSCGMGMYPFSVDFQ